jgi:TPR repeat protein
MRLILATAFAAALLCSAPLSARAQDDPAQDPGTAAFNDGDYTGAMDVWKPKADAGDPEAMTNVGMLYNLGLGVKRSYKEAAQWYERAAQLGFVLAQYDLANLYYDGLGVERDRKQAARWYLAAAKGGHPKAQLYLAQMYESGEGVEENHDTALQWYQKAADQNLPEGQYELGRKLVYGDDVQPDGAKGTDLLLKSAEQGYPKAQMLIADCYWRARGVPKNLIEAYVWAAQAVENPKNRQSKDKAKAANLLDDIKSNMTGDQIKAAEIELKAVAPKKADDKDQKKSGASAPGDGGSGDNPQ